MRSRSARSSRFSRSVAFGDGKFIQEMFDQRRYGCVLLGGFYARFPICFIIYSNCDISHIFTLSQTNSISTPDFWSGGRIPG